MNGRAVPLILILGATLAGLAHQCWFLGWPGLVDGILGLTVAVGMLLIPYRLGGIDEGYLKALASLGAWLGPGRVFLLFSYMGCMAGLLALYAIWSRGELVWRMRCCGAALFNRVCRRPLEAAVSPNQARITMMAIPYGVVLMLGVVSVFLKEM